MAIRFLRGTADRPRGHALVAFRANRASDDAYVTYVVVLPIIVEPMKYLPPVFASQFQGMAGALQGLDAVPMPPIPERMAIPTAVRIAERRDDDVVDAGVTDGDPVGLMSLAQEAVREYAALYRAAEIRLDATAPDPLHAQTLTDAPQAPQDDDSFRWLLMDERGRIDEMTRLVGRLRDVVERGVRDELESVRSLLVRLASTLPPKYRANELIAGASRPGQTGTRLAELYLDRCYRLCSERYEGLADVDREISALEGNATA